MMPLSRKWRVLSLLLQELVYLRNNTAVSLQKEHESVSSAMTFESWSQSSLNNLGLGLDGSSLNFAS